MRIQFYVFLDKHKEQELFQFVREQCALEVLPSLVTCEQGDLPEQGKYFLVNRSDADRFCYDKQIDEQKQHMSVIRPLDDCQNILPYIEYSYECHEHGIAARLWGPSTTTSTGSVLVNKMKAIRAWIKDGCIAKEKNGCIWIYYL